MQYGRTLTVAGALALAACGAAVGAMGITDFKAMQQGIEAQARAAERACGQLGGTARALCETQAEGHAKVAKAQLEARPPARLPQLCLAPPVLAHRGAEAAGEVDDAPAGVAQRHQRGGSADQLVVGMGREVEDRGAHTHSPRPPTPRSPQPR